MSTPEVYQAIYEKQRELIATVREFRNMQDAICDRLVDLKNDNIALLAEFRELLKEYKNGLLAEKISEWVEREHARRKADPNYSPFDYPPPPIGPNE